MGHGSNRTSVEWLLQLKMTEAIALMELRTLGRVRPKCSATFSSVLTSSHPRITVLFVLKKSAGRGRNAYYII